MTGKRLANSVLDRMADHEDVTPTPRADAATTKTRGVGRRRAKWIVPILLCSAVGIGLLAVADGASRTGNDSIPKYLLYWLGLLLIFMPVAGRALARDVDRTERLILVISLGVALYMVKVLGSPYGFTYVDEYIHVRSTQDILDNHHLFAWNPLLPAASYYPGLPTLTAGIVDFTGLSIFTAGLLIIGVARVLISAALFLGAERITGSSRGAAAASILYAANPMFLAWSSAFAYENIALPFAAFLIWWVAWTRARDGIAATVVSVLSIVAITVSHHIVGFALSALFIIWWGVEIIWCRATKRARRYVGLLALMSTAVTLIWFFVVARPAPSYLLQGNLFPAISDTGSLFFGKSVPRELFKSGGFTPPIWEPIVGFAAIIALLVVLPFALRRAWTMRHRAAIIVTAFVAIAYPVSLVPRLAPRGVGISGRTSEYIFAGLGCIIGLLFAATLARNREGHHRKMSAWKKPAMATLGATLLATVVFVGNVTVGNPYYQRLPEGPDPHYEWSVQPDVVAASKWARDNLGVNQRFGANAIDSLALATHGNQDIVDWKQAWPIFFGGDLSGDAVEKIKSERVEYLLINWRMTRWVPLTPGYYFTPDEPDAGEYEHAFPPDGLKKFFASPCVELLYQTKMVQIVDISRISDGTCE